MVGAAAAGAGGGSYVDGELVLSGFDLRTAMQSGDLAELKGHMRFLHDLVRGMSIDPVVT